jgi:hypothetical protein
MKLKIDVYEQGNGMTNLIDYIKTTDIEIPRVDLIMLDMQVNDLAYLLSEHCLNVDSTLWSLLAMLEDVLLEYDNHGR